MKTRSTPRTISLALTVVVVGVPGFALAQDVGVTGVVAPANDACGLSQQPLEVTVQNFGNVDATGFAVSATIIGATPNALSTNYTGTLAPGATGTLVLGNIDTFDGGQVAVDVSTNLTGDTVPANDAFQANIPIDPGRIPILPIAPLCPGSTRTVMVGMEPGAQYGWFDAAQAGTQLAAGTSFTTPALTQTSDFWVERLNGLATAGLPNMASGPGSYLSPDLRITDPYGLVFDVNSPTNLASVTVYASGAGSVTVRLLSGRVPAGGTVLQTATVPSPGAGAVTVPLNFALTPGTGYVLDAVGTTTTLYRIFSSGSIPYPMVSTDGSITIVTQTFNSTSDYYYWFFDWQIATTGCSGERTPITVPVDPAACLADMEIVSTAPTTAFRGGTVTVTSIIENLGPDIAVGAALDATPPAGMTFTSNAGACTTPFPCALGDLAPGAPTSVQSTWTVPVGYSGPSTLTFAMDVSSAEVDPDPANDTSSVDLQLVEPVDLGVTVDSATVASGGRPLTYTVTVTNAGPGDAVETFVDIPLDPLFTRATTTGCLNDPRGTPSCSLGTLPVGATRTITVVAESGPATTGNASLSASVRTASPDANAANDSATITRFLELVTDLEVSIFLNPSPAVPGGPPSVVTVRLTNNGPSASTGAVMSLVLPPELFNVSTEGCDEDPMGLPTCTISDVIPPGGAVEVRATGSLARDEIGAGNVDVAVVSNNTDPDPSNDSARYVVRYVPSADVSLGIVPPRGEIVAGLPVEFSVRVFSYGPSNANDATVQINVQDALEGVRTSGCPEDPGGVPTCTIGLLEPGSNHAFTLTASVGASVVGPFDTQFVLTAAGTDPVPVNNTVDIQLEAVARSNIVVGLGPEDVEVVSGSEIDLTFSVEAGPSDATGVWAEFTLPEELVRVSTQGCANDPDGLPRCEIPVAPAGAPTEVTITARARAVEGPTPVLVTVTATPESGGNQIEDDTASLEVVIVPRTDVDLSATAMVDKETADPGDNVTFIVMVRNAGPGTAGGVAVDVELPSGVTLTESQGCDEDPAASSICTFGTLRAGNTATARFRAKVNADADGVQVFRGTARSGNEEIAPGDEAAEVEITVRGVTPDAGVPDSGAGGGGDLDDGGGCTCAAPASPAPWTLGLLLLLPLLRRRRDR